LQFRDFAILRLWNPAFGINWSFSVAAYLQIIDLGHINP
jgi:hypothetical protein